MGRCTGEGCQMPTGPAAGLLSSSQGVYLIYCAGLRVDGLKPRAAVKEANTSNRSLSSVPHSTRPQTDSLNQVACPQPYVTHSNSLKVLRIQREKDAQGVDIRAREIQLLFENKNGK
jgi:hypothetical protein